jgi:HAMP domain-containing protein
MKTSLIKVVFISVLLLSLLLLILGLGIVPWIKSETQEKRVKNTRSIMSALASSFELGALTEEPYFLEEPIKHLAGETSAQYLVVYNLSGTAIAGSSQEKDLPPLPENVLKAMQTEAKAMVDATGKYTDLYVPIWNRSPSGLALDESQIFFPDRQASKNRLADASVRVAGILRLALPNLPARGIPLPTGVNGVYLILAVLGAALVLFFTIWWSWVKRLHPISRSISQYAMGNYTHRMPKQQSAELKRLSEGINLVGDKLEQLNEKVAGFESERFYAEQEGRTTGVIRKMVKELTSPAGFLYMNLYKLLEYVINILKVQDAYSKLKLDSQEAQELEDMKQDTEYDHVMEDLERLVRSCVKAIEKVKAVTTDMRKILSTELDTPAKKSQINKIVSAALERVRHNSQPRITLITNLDESLDAVYPFRTVVPLFVNIVEDAVESIGGR